MDLLYTRRRSCSLECHYWCCRRQARSSPGQQNKAEGNLHPAALCTLPLARGWKGRTSHRREGRGRTEMKILSITHLPAHPPPFNLLWKSDEVFSVSFQSVRTNMRVWKHLGIENMLCETWFEIPVCGIYWAGSCSSPFWQGWAKPRAKQGQELTSSSRSPATARQEQPHLNSSETQTKPDPTPPLTTDHSQPSGTDCCRVSFVSQEVPLWT